MEKIPILTFHETSPIDRSFQLVRHWFKPRTGFHLHGHRDFCEFFWVESGSGVHRINGLEQRLAPGMFVMVRQKDAHAFRTRSGETLTLVNFSFPVTNIGGWHRLYFNSKPLFFWSKGILPHTQSLAPAQMQRLAHWTDLLSTCPNDRFHFDWFLLDLLHSLQSNEGADQKPETLPERLAVALGLLREPRAFSGGVHQLAKLAGCSLQHLNRLLKKQRRPSAGEIVTESRLLYAARQLRLTDRKIVDVGFASGFNNLGHFYLLFKRRYGLTPHQFRLRQRSTIGLNR